MSSDILKHKKAQLTSQSHHWFITIRKNVDLSISKIKQWCELHSLGDMYAFIEHKGDISCDTGLVEGTHYHIVLNTEKKVRKSQLLNDIVKQFDFDNPFGIELDIYQSFEGCLQYLTHQNVKEKTQHDKSEIVHNIDKDTFLAIMETPLATQLCTSQLVYLIEQAKTPIDLCRELGLGTFDHYLKTIKVLWRYIKGENI